MIKKLSNAIIFMHSVLVQVWGPANAMFGGYDWITAGIIETDVIDIEMLKGKAMKIIEQRDYKPFMNAIRLKIMHGNQTEMKVTLTDLW